MRSITTLTLLLLALSVRSQNTGDFMLGIGTDLLKTDIQEPFNKAQVGLELNYFVKKNFSATLGADIWSRGDDSFVVGMRWYFIDVSSHSRANYYFLRLRGLIGVNDVALGLGWARALTSTLRAEAFGDYYFNGEFGIRGGIAYVFR
jgi:hypothetical protein